MATILKNILSQLGGDGLAQLGSLLGENKRSTKSALSTVIPSLVVALGRNSSSSDGAQALTEALIKNHDGSILENITDSLQNINQQDSDGILGHILGSKRKNVEAGLSKSTGLNIGSIVKLLGIAAPLLMGVLGKNRRENNLEANNISDLLQRDSRRINRRTSRKLSPIMQVLDSDGDGSVTEELVGFGAGLLKRLFGHR